MKMQTSLAGTTCPEEDRGHPRTAVVQPSAFDVNYRVNTAETLTFLNDVLAQVQ